MSKNKIESITQERGNDYGLPIDQFHTTQSMYNIWVSRRSTSNNKLPKPLESVLRHIVYMIIDKLVRTAENPLKKDGFDDIQGYASLMEPSVKEYKDRENDENITFK